MIRFIAVGALLACAAASAEITYPVDRAGTAGQWVIWDLQGGPEGTGGIFRRNVTWPVADGGPVPGLEARYVFVLATRSDPPEIDSRFQEVVYPCPEVLDLAAATLKTTCAATLRPEADLITAVHSAAGERKAQAMAAFGIDSPADQTRALALLLAERAGQVLSAADEAWLTGLGSLGVTYLDQVDDKADEIIAWIKAHPGQVPAVGESEWPPLPEAPAGME